MVIDPVSITISVLALAVSTAVAWLTFFRRGILGMTRPSLVAFLHDLSRRDPLSVLLEGPETGAKSQDPYPKIYFRALLYATGRRGHIVESMFVRLHRGETVQTFNYWAYGEGDRLHPGSGVRVGEEGAVYNHHFLPPRDGTVFQFLAGEYRLEVYGTLVNQGAPVLLQTINLVLSEEQAVALKTKTTPVFYNWGPESQTYHGHIDIRPRTLGVAG
ncbi:MAG: hypothetical protein C5B51_01620 [Terriglobia bacterium]|nr:MAG: hypothetical protein C5B51_01620 [Terriglobia bacterium]